MIVRSWIFYSPSEIRDPNKVRTNFTDTSFDVIILGFGPAGMSCAMWCADLGIRALVIEPAPHLGGQLRWIYNPITNHLGADAADGMELLENFSSQIAERDFCLSLGVGIDSVSVGSKSVVLADGREFNSRFLVIASGVSRRNLGIPGESDFVGRGILESGMKMRTAVRGKRVAVIGGGDAAVENALILSEAGADVALVHRRSDFSCQLQFIEEVRNRPNVRIIAKAVVEEICGGESVEALLIRHLDSGLDERLATDHVLVRIGVTPNTSFLWQTVDLNAQGYILTDSSQHASVEGVFAIGDVANPLAPTISSAVGQGAVAAKTIAHRMARAV